MAQIGLLEMLMAQITTEELKVEFMVGLKNSMFLKKHQIFKIILEQLTKVPLMLLDQIELVLEVMPHGQNKDNLVDKAVQINTAQTWKKLLGAVED